MLQLRALRLNFVGTEFGARGQGHGHRSLYSSRRAINFRVVDNYSVISPCPEPVIRPEFQFPELVCMLFVPYLESCDPFKDEQISGLQDN